MAKYGSRTKAAFKSLGMRPVEILDNKEDSVRLEEVIEELRNDREVETVVEPFVRKYFEVLEDKGMIEYDDNGVLFDAGNRLVYKKRLFQPKDPGLCRKLWA